MRLNSQELGTCTARTGRPITPCASHQLFWHLAWWDQTHIAKATGTIMMEGVTRIIMCKLLCSCSGGVFSPSSFPSIQLSTPWRAHKTHSSVWRSRFWTGSTTGRETITPLISVVSNLKNAPRKIGNAKVKNVCLNPRWKHEYFHWFLKKKFKRNKF